jgi:hypothetical protein
MVKSTAAVLADRLSGLIALATICTVSSAITYQSMGRRIFIVLPLLLLLAQLAVALALLWPASSRRLMARLGFGRIPHLMSFVERLFISFQTYRKHPSLIVRIVGISFLFQFLVIIAVFCLSRALALDVRFIGFLVFVPIITILESIPISIYGLGLRDAGYVLFFRQMGLPSAEAHALAMSVLYVVMTAGYCALGGILLAHRMFKRGATEKSDGPDKAREPSL